MFKPNFYLLIGLFLITACEKNDLDEIGNTENEYSETVTIDGNANSIYMDVARAKKFDNLIADGTVTYELSVTGEIGFSDGGNVNAPGLVVFYDDNHYTTWKTIPSGSSLTFTPRNFNFIYCAILDLSSGSTNTGEYEVILTEKGTNNHERVIIDGNVNSIYMDVARAKKFDNLIADGTVTYELSVTGEIGFSDGGNVNAPGLVVFYDDNHYTTWKTIPSGSSLTFTPQNFNFIYCAILDLSSGSKNNGEFMVTLKNK